MSRSAFYADGFSAGYRSCTEPTEPNPPDHPIYRTEYMDGWTNGINEARIDLMAERHEREWNDWQAKL